MDNAQLTMDNGQGTIDNSQLSIVNSPLVPPGYKQTEVGVIPEDWEVCTIQELINQNAIIGHLDGNHGELYPRSHEFKAFGVPYITANDFCGYKVNFANCKYLSEERACQFRKGVAKNGDVLFAHNATVGPTALLSTQLDYVILSTTATYFRCNPEKLVNSFLLYLLQSPFFVHQYQSVMSQSTRNQVPITTQRKLTVAFPPTLVEQEAIAAALSDADALIEALEQLIAKKRQVKQGAMQELLTGKRRLPEFSGEWEVNSFEDVFVRLNSKNHQIQTSDYNKIGVYPVVDQGKEKVVGYSDRDDKVFQCPQEGVVIFGDHTCIIKFVNFDFIVGADGTQILTTKTGHCTHFYAFQLEHSGILPTGYNRHFKFLKERLFLTPTLPEQTTIACILSDMDAELSALEEKLAKARQVKQGMMQELLTGRTRLIENG